MKIATSAQARSIDERAQQRFGIPSLLLMENAALAVVDVIDAHYAEAQRIAIFCGAGQNGGDGLAVARLLSTRGIAVDVFLTTPRAAVRGDATIQLGICERMGIPLHDLAESVSETLARASLCDLIVDAIFGTGLSRPLEGSMAELVEGIAELRLPVLAVDVPSGIDASSHEAPVTAIRADMTVTFEQPKICHVFEPAATWCGEVVVAPIGLPHPAVEAEGILLSLTTLADVAPLCASRESNTHKGSYGHVGIIAGSEGHSGAAILAARGAIRCGAGLVTVLTDRETARLVDAVSVESMTQVFDVRQDLALSLQSLERFDAIVIGPGIAEDEETRQAVRELIRALPQPVVIDAGALNAFAGHAGPVGAHSEGQDDAWHAAVRVITPHPGEASRLLDRPTAAISQDRIAAAGELSRITGAVTVLKGHQTLVADPAGPVAVNPTGNAGMASGGMGDVLSGMIGALLARGEDPFESARAAVYLHGYAGDLVAEAGDIGLAAMDVADAIPRAVRELRETGE